MGDQINSTLSRTAFTAVCRQLEESIRSEKASASFACGGTIPVRNIDESQDVGALKSSGPINVFWKLKSGAQKLTLPLGSCVDGDVEDGSNTRLRQLVADCEPAGFGRGQEDVMDLEYRRAGKLETHQFATSFHPADFGIVERVEQVLLPTLNQPKEPKEPSESSESRKSGKSSKSSEPNDAKEASGNVLQMRRMEIELYKLNVSYYYINTKYMPCLLLMLSIYDIGLLRSFRSIQEPR